jgi:hypothetical protein
MERNRPLSPRQQEAMEQAETLISWFEGKDLPRPPVLLSPGTMITNVQKFLEVQICVIRANKVFSWGWGAALERLQTFKNVVEHAKETR